MVTEIIQAWHDHDAELKEWLRTTPQETYCSYDKLLKVTLQFMFSGDKYGMPDHERITKIDHGEFQGTLVFVIGGHGYQPSADDHWYTSVDYGSCSGCDTLEAIECEDYGKFATESQVQQYWTLCLHMVQKMRRMYNTNEEDDK